MKKQFLSLLLALILILSSLTTAIPVPAAAGGAAGPGVSTGTEEESVKKPQSVTITGKHTVEKGKTITLKATVLPKDASQKVTWKSSNPSVAKISSSGKVTGLKAGTVTVTAVSKAKKTVKATWKITVSAAKDPESITVTGKHTVKKGKTISLKAAVLPESASQKVIWKSSNPSIAKISSDGKVTGLKAGTVTVTVSSGAKKTVKTSWKITVTAEKTPKSITISGKHTVKTGKTVTLKANVLPKGVSQKVTWKSSDPSIAKVNSAGKVTGLKKGKVTITVISKAQKTVKATWKITVDSALKVKVSKSAKADAGKKVSFKVTAKGAEGKVKYQWQESTNNGKTWKKTKESGKNTRTLKITVSGKHYTRLYRCKVTDQSGTVYSDPVYVEPADAKDFVYTDGKTSWKIQKYTGKKANVEIPRGHKGRKTSEILASAFEGSKAVFVTVPTTISRIGDKAFRKCSQLAYIYIPSSVKSIGKKAFDKCSPDLYVIVEKKSYAEKYCKANGIKYTYKIPEGAAIANLSASETNFKAEVQNEVVFTAESSVAMPVFLYLEDNECVGEMHDDGLNGDETAGDGVYSLKLNVRSDEAGEKKYFAGNWKVESGRLSLYFFIDPTADADQAKETILEIQQAVGAAVQSGGSTAAKLKAVKMAVEAMAENGDVISYSASEGGIYYKTKYGLTMCYVPETANTSAGSGTPMRIYTLQPSNAEFVARGTDSAQAEGYPAEAAQKIAGTFSNYTYASAWYNNDITLSRIRNIGANQIVLWDGHGGYDKNLGPTLVTGEDFDLGAWLWDISYWWDCVTDRILHDWSGKVRVTHKYITHYCGNMSNSLIYLGTCSSGKSKQLAKAFLDKGAAAVVGNDEVIYTIYTNLMMKSIITTMCEVNPDTGDYYTLGEALAEAKRVNGADDIQWGYYTGNSKAAAKPVIFGGTSAENYRLGHTGEGILKGKVSNAQTLDPVSGASIRVYRNGQQIRTGATDAGGSYEITELKAGTYRIEISAANYVQFEGTARIWEDETTYMETFLLVEGQEGQTGTASGTIFHAFTRVNLADVQLSVKKGWNSSQNAETKAQTKTNGEGAYSFELPIGNYTVFAEKEGFTTSSFNIVVLPNTEKGGQNYGLTPVSSAGQYRIELTWGENPRDLDSHLVGTYSNGNQYHVYFSNKRAYENGELICDLDVDDTTSFGPEVVTLTASEAQNYYYYVHLYAGIGTIPTSGARIEVRYEGKLIRTFNISESFENKRYWNVFAIKDGRLVVKNTMSDSPELNY